MRAVMNGGAASLLTALALLACAVSCTTRADAPVLTPVPARPPVAASKPPPAAPPDPAPAPAPAPPPAPGTINKVRAIVAHDLDLPVLEVPVEAPLSALRKPADELSVVEIVLSLEEAFHIEIADQDLEDATGGPSPGAVSHLSVRTLAGIVEKRSRRGRSRPAP
jgi:acyl carrier protein